MLNNRLERVQVGRDHEVPIENDSSLWLLWYYEDGSWDSEAISQWRSIVDEWNKKKVKEIFCVWHGNYRTNLFLMNQEKLIERFKAMSK